jgi:hypothetical protein
VIEPRNTVWSESLALQRAGAALPEPRGRGSGSSTGVGEQGIDETRVPWELVRTMINLLGNHRTGRHRFTNVLALRPAQNCPGGVSEAGRTPEYTNGEGQLKPGVEGIFGSRSAPIVPQQTRRSVLWREPWSREGKTERGCLDTESLGRNTGKDIEQCKTCTRNNNE